VLGGLAMTLRGARRVPGTSRGAENSPGTPDIQHPTPDTWPVTYTLSPDTSRQARPQGRF